MSTDLEQRVAALESKYAELLETIRRDHDKPAEDGWRKVVGMFADDPDIAAHHGETRRIREEDRAAARDTDRGDT